MSLLRGLGNARPPWARSIRPIRRHESIPRPVAGRARTIVPRVGKSFVAGKRVELARRLALVGKSRMVPAARIRVASELHGIVGRASLATAADVHGHDAVVPVGRIGDTIDDPNVMDAVSRRVELETSHAVGIRRVLDADDVVATSVRERVNVRVVDEDIVYAAVQLVVVACDDAHAVGRVADVEDNETIFAIGRSLAADDGGGAVFGELDVVDRARIHAHGIDELNAVGLGADGS